jgi:hypothetical protein
LRNEAQNTPVWFFIPGYRPERCPCTQSVVAYRPCRVASLGPLHWTTWPTLSQPSYVAKPLQKRRGSSMSIQLTVLEPTFEASLFDCKWLCTARRPPYVCPPRNMATDHSANSDRAITAVYLSWHKSPIHGVEVTLCKILAQRQLAPYERSSRTRISTIWRTQSTEDRTPRSHHRCICLLQSIFKS